MSTHDIRREQDEYTCSCGLRWDVNECDPHEAYEPGMCEGCGVETSVTLCSRCSFSAFGDPR